MTTPNTRCLRHPIAIALALCTFAAAQRPPSVPADRSLAPSSDSAIYVLILDTLHARASDAYVYPEFGSSNTDVQISEAKEAASKTEGISADVFLKSTTKAADSSSLVRVIGHARGIRWISTRPTPTRFPELARRIGLSRASYTTDSSRAVVFATV